MQSVISSLSSSSSKVKSFIKQIRSCNTAAEERALIARECANIRSEMSDLNNSTRQTNISKLLVHNNNNSSHHTKNKQNLFFFQQYIHMLGYPTSFGQMECLKLITSPYFNDKRVGYLGIMMLLDEKQEILTLVTNTLQK